MLLPARAKNYRENLLDTFLSTGEYFWHMEEQGNICFSPAHKIDWDGEVRIPYEVLSEKEKILVQALSKRGASFMQALSGVISGESPYDTLLSLMEKGIVYADSFVPVRQWLDREKLHKGTARLRAGARARAMQAGRWEIGRAHV